MKHNKKDSGFTLIELIVVIAILAILATLAAPSFGRMLERNKMQTLVGEWRSAFYLAQSEALRLKHRIQLCPSKNGTTCDAGGDFSQGWIIIDTSENNALIQDYPPTNSDIVVNLSPKPTTPPSSTTLTELVFLNNGRLPHTAPDLQLELTSKKYPDLKSISLTITRSGQIIAGN